MERGASLRRRRGVDQVADRFRLKQVEFSVEHRAAGELARGGGACPRGLQRGEELHRRQKTAVTGQFHQVLAGVAVRGAKNGDQALIDRSAIDGAKGGSGGGAGPASVERAAVDDPSNHLEGPASRDPHHRDGGATGSRGECGDRIGEHVERVKIRRDRRAAPVRLS
jgi:hypothetical protein